MSMNHGSSDFAHFDWLALEVVLSRLSVLAIPSEEYISFNILFNNAIYVYMLYAYIIGLSLDPGLYFSYVHLHFVTDTGE